MPAKLRCFPQSAVDSVNNSMSKRSKAETYFHLHLVSDATGETLNTIAKAATAQFVGARPLEHTYALVRSERQMTRVLQEIEAAPGVVMFTLMSDELRTLLENRCRELMVPAISVLDPAIDALAQYLGADRSHKPGGQHELNARYFYRIEALNFTMAHDDGQNVSDLDHAEIVLVGVSRTSKTPTCIYLANRGFRAANVPIVPNVPLPPGLESLKGPLIVGLTANPSRLIQIRKNRLLALTREDLPESDYIDEDSVREEIVFARRVFERCGWPIIDVSRRSIEETAAEILNLYQAQGPT